MVCHTDLMTACEQDQDGAPDEGQRNCPKHVEFYSKNKFQKLVHLVCCDKIEKNEMGWACGAYG